MSSYYLVKVVVCGDMSVGKTSLIRRYVQNNFVGNTASTIGIDFQVKTITTQDGRQVRLQIWDTAGQERFHSMVRTYFRDTQLILFIYAVDDVESFNKIKTWMHLAGWTLQPDNSYGNGCETQAVLIANKCDLEPKIPPKSARKFALEHNMQFYEMSAKTGDYVQDSFTKINNQLVLLHDKYVQNQDAAYLTLGVVRESEPIQTKKCCQ